MPLRSGRYPAVESALLDLDHAMAPFAKQVVVMVVSAKAKALFTAVVRQNVDDALLAEKRERAIDGCETCPRVALAEAAPQLLCRHVVALPRELLEHLEPPRCRTDIVPLEQLRQLGHVHYPSHSWE